MKTILLYILATIGALFVLRSLFILFTMFIACVSAAVFGLLGYTTSAHKVQEGVV